MPVTFGPRNRKADGRGALRFLAIDSSKFSGTGAVAGEATQPDADAAARQRIADADAAIRNAEERARKAEAAAREAEANAQRRIANAAKAETENTGKSGPSQGSSDYVPTIGTDGRIVPPPNFGTPEQKREDVDRYHAAIAEQKRKGAETTRLADEAKNDTQKQLLNKGSALTTVDELQASCDENRKAANSRTMTKWNSLCFDKLRLLARQEKEKTEAETNARLIERGAAITTADELQAFCHEHFRSRPPSVNDARNLLCYDKLSELQAREKAEKVKKAEEKAKAEAESSAPILADLIKKLLAMPDTEETFNELNRLYRSDSRHPGLTDADEGTYRTAITHRQDLIVDRLTIAACKPAVSKIFESPEILNATVLDNREGVNFTVFLCGPVLSTKDISVKLGEKDTVIVAVDQSTLIFSRGRYIEGAGFVALDSELKGGDYALALKGIMVDGESEVFNKWFVFNFHGRYRGLVLKLLREKYPALVAK